MHIHFIGICGTFMSGLARLATQLGHQVTGSDRAFYPPMSEQIANMGVVTYSGFGDEVWGELNPDLVIVGNVASRGMPIVEKMLEKQLPYTSGPALLGEVLRSKKVFAIAGTHGKTTTTSMLIHMLKSQGIDCGYLVGGVVKSFEHSASWGDSDYFVIEADEYDSAYFDKRPKFIHYSPYNFVIGNLEFDHADIYNSVAEIEKQFQFGVRLVPPQGRVIFGMGESVDKVKSKGVWARSVDITERFQIKAGALFEDNQAICQFPDTVLGMHNQSNALMAAVVAEDAGFSIEASINSLSNYEGVRRRLEKRGEVTGISVYDDFAHHPTAVNFTLSTMQAKYPDGRVIAVLEPRSNTMKTGFFAEPLQSALAIADKAYAFIEKDDWQIAETVAHFTDLNKLIDALVNDAKTGDQIVIMSNGDFQGIHQKLLDALVISTNQQG